MFGKSKLSRLSDSERAEVLFGREVRGGKMVGGIENELKEKRMREAKNEFFEREKRSVLKVPSKPSVGVPSFLKRKQRGEFF